MQFETLGHYHDAWADLLSQAPNDFQTLDGDLVVDQRDALASAFRELREGFVLVERKLKNLRLCSILREMIEMSYEAFTDNNEKKGALILQECEGLIWPSQKQPTKYAPEAEKRVFQTLELFRNVIVSPYPYEVSESELGEGQRKLLAFAQRLTLEYVDKQNGFRLLAFALAPDGDIINFIRSSKKRTLTDLREAAAKNYIVGSIVAEFPFGGIDGLLIFDIEEHSCPMAEAISRVQGWKMAPFNYRFRDPIIFIAPKNTA